MSGLDGLLPTPTAAAAAVVVAAAWAFVAFSPLLALLQLPPAGLFPVIGTTAATGDAGDAAAAEDNSLLLALAEAAGAERAISRSRRRLCRAEAVSPKV